MLRQANRLLGAGAATAVLIGVTATAAWAAELDVTPREARPGDYLQADVSGLQDLEQIDVSWNGSLLVTLRSDVGGEFAGCVQVPRTAPDGSHELSLVPATTAGELVATITVAADAEPTDVDCPPGGGSGDETGDDDGTDGGGDDGGDDGTDTGGDDGSDDGTDSGTDGGTDSGGDGGDGGMDGGSDSGGGPGGGGGGAGLPNTGSAGINPLILGAGALAGAGALTAWLSRTRPRHG